MMNWNLISDNWNHLAPKAQMHWDKLTHEDLKEIEGNQEALTAKLQARYGFLRMDAERKVAEWGEELMPELEKASRSARPERQSQVGRSARGTDAVRSIDEHDKDHTKSAEGEELPDVDPRFKVADEERPESPTSKLTPPLDRRNESRDRPAVRSSSDNVIP